MSFGSSLRHVRRIQGLTLRELARRIKISASYLSDIELNRRTPSLPVHRGLLTVLGSVGIEPLPKCPYCGHRLPPGGLKG